MGEICHLGIFRVRKCNIVVRLPYKVCLSEDVIFSQITVLN
jgi:hypothetical protein